MIKYFSFSFFLFLLVCSAGCITGTPRMLIDKEFTSSMLYTAAHADRTLSIPSVFRLLNDDVVCLVTQNDFLGDSKGVAVFSASDIVVHKFKKLFSSNFHTVCGDEKPVMVFSVKIDAASAKKENFRDIVESTLVAQIKMTNQDCSKVCYSKKFTSTVSAVWDDKNSVPSAFYLAVDDLMEAFIIDWNKNSSWKDIVQWRNKSDKTKRPPSLKTIEWSKNDDIWLGRCEVNCNDYEGFEAKSWANMQIANVCRTKLGNIERERVRVLYDVEKFDEQSRKWILEFRTFARTKMALSFNPVTRHGLVVGDVELISANSVEEASDILKKYVLKEMQSHGRLVGNIGEENQARVRFDNFDTDTAYNIITIRFRLIK